MAISPPASGALPEKRRLPAGLIVSEMWTSIAISVIWLSVLFTALFGPDIVTFNVSGSSSRVPSGIVVALFAYLATRVVAKHGFGRSDRADRDSAST